MENMYGPAAQDMDDVLVQAPGQPPAEKILDQYIQAAGGAERLATMKSYVATGTSVGFGGFGKGGQVEMVGKFPDQGATSVVFPKEPERGTSIRSFNGHEAWLRTPLTVLSEYQLTGGELDGAKLDAQLSFPGQIKSVLTNWRVSMPTTISDLPAPSSQAVEETKTAGIGKDRLVNVVQGRGSQWHLRHAVFRSAVGPSPSPGALWQLAHWPRSHRDRLLRLSGRGWNQNAVPYPLRLVGTDATNFNSIR